jgi:hypothetical protein
MKIKKIRPVCIVEGCKSHVSEAGYRCEKHEYQYYRPAFNFSQRSAGCGGGHRTPKRGDSDCGEME